MPPARPPAPGVWYPPPVAPVPPALPAPSSGDAGAGFAPPQPVPPTPQPTPVPREALDYPVMFNPAPAVARWYGLRRAMWWSLGSLVVGLGIWAAIWWFTRDTWSDTMWWFVGVSVGISVILSLRAVFRMVAARRELRLVAEGLALGVGRGGLFAEGRFVPWTALGSVETRPARVGRTSRLVLLPAEGEPIRLPLDYLAATPADLDGAVRALSGGRSRVDLSRLDV